MKIEPGTPSSDSDPLVSKAEAQPARPRGWFRRLIGWSGRVLLGLFCLLAGYLLLALVGLYPSHASFEEPEQGVDIYVFSGAFHSDIILPIRNETIDWTREFAATDFGQDVSAATHVAFGWGDESFYLHTPTWADLKISTAANAMLIPSSTVMHVSMHFEPTVGDSIRKVRVSREQYAKLVDYVNQSFALDANASRIRIADHAYSTNDAFYRAKGSYHLFRTCNCWVGETMRAGEIPCGWFTPLPRSVFWHLPPRMASSQVP